MEWKRGKEATYHIEISPKNFNFKKITKIMNFTFFYLNTPYFSADITPISPIFLIKPFF